MTDAPSPSSAAPGSFFGPLPGFDGKVVVVTGSSSGIGEATVRLAAMSGAKVVVNSSSSVAAGQAVVAAIGADRASYVQADVSSEAGAAAIAAHAAERWGGIDVLVNNAGTYREAGSILDQSHESWRRSIDVNLAGLFNCSKPTARAMADQGRGGAIVNIASVDGLLPCLGTGYDSAKAGAIHFTRSLAVDLAPHRVRVNAVAPGYVPVPTLQRINRGELPPLWPANPSLSGLMGPMMRQRGANIPLGRQGTTDDIAHAVLFLCSTASSYVTGQTVTVDGGWTLV